MSFLQPVVLWALPALLVPLLIHLWHRRRHQSIDWAAMRFLRQAMQQNRGHRRLRHFLILACRVLAVGAVIFAMSRPLAGSWRGWRWIAAPHRILVIVDRSPSMGRVGPGATAASEATFTGLRAAAAERDFPRLRFLDDEFPDLDVERSDWARAEGLCLQLNSASCDVPGLLEAALAQLIEEEAGQAEIWIASDLSSADWAPADPRWEDIRARLARRSDRVGLRIFAPSADPAPNATLTLEGAERRAGGRLHLRLSITHEGMDGQLLPLSISHEGNREVRQIPLDERRVEISHPVTVGPDSGWGELSIGADGNAADNATWFAYPAREAPAVLLAGPDDFTTAVLGAALEGDTAGSRVPVERSLSLAGAMEADWTAVVVSGAGSLTGDDTEALLGYLDRGGRALVFAGGETAALAIGPVTFGAVVEPLPEAAELAVRDWERRGDLLADTEAGEALPMDLLRVRRWQPLALTEGEVLARMGPEGIPLAVRLDRTPGSAVIVTTRPDDAWSNLADGPVLVPLAQRFLTGALRERTARHLRRAGAPGQTADEAPLRLAGPSPEGSDPRWHAGAYLEADGRAVAVNLPTGEGSAPRLTEAELRALLGGGATVDFAGSRSTPGWDLSSEIWRLFVAALLLVLLAEAALSLPPRPAPKPASP